MALVDTKGNSDAAISRYIELRVLALIEEEKHLNSRAENDRQPQRITGVEAAGLAEQHWLPSDCVEIERYMSLLRLDRKSIEQRFAMGLIPGIYYSSKWYIKEKNVGLLGEESEEYLYIKKVALDKGLDIVIEENGFSVKRNDRQIRFSFSLKGLREFVLEY